MCSAHVLHKILMPGHVRDADAEPLIHRSQIEMRKAKLDGDAARFFFRQPVGVRAAQRFHERDLPKMNVARGAPEARALNAFLKKIKRIRHRGTRTR